MCQSTGVSWLDHPSLSQTFPCVAHPCCLPRAVDSRQAPREVMANLAPGSSSSCRKPNQVRSRQLHSPLHRCSSPWAVAPTAASQLGEGAWRKNPKFQSCPVGCDSLPSASPSALAEQWEQAQLSTLSPPGGHPSHVPPGIPQICPSPHLGSAELLPEPGGAVGHCRGRPGLKPGFKARL